VHVKRSAPGLVLLVLLAAGSGCVATARPISHLAYGQGEPPESSGTFITGYDAPGRRPDSEVPWELFLGNAAHTIIAYMYEVDHPLSTGFYNKEPLTRILTDSRLGDPSLLQESERRLRPDITDVTLLHLFEIKPWSGEALLEGRQEVRIYLTALNRAARPGIRFAPGTDCQGTILIRFAQGQHIWRLEWKTSEPGVVQYRWSRSQERFDSEVEAHRAARWVELTEEELRRYGGWVGQVVEEMVGRRRKLASFSGAVGSVIEAAGDAAVMIFSGVIFRRMGSTPKAQQPTTRPPTQQGGKVIPFPERPSPSAPPVQRPAASGM
jgi:hypothetical protein